MGKVLQRLSFPGISLFLILFTLFLAACGGGETGPGARAAAVPPWRQVVRFEGRESMQTEVFTIPQEATEWRITWNTKPGDVFGYLTVVVHRAGGELVTTAADVKGSSFSSQTFQGGGEYYLAIDTNQPFTITVEAK